MKKSLILLSIVLGLAVGTTHAADTYEVDTSHASIGFAVKHMVISKVKGSFTNFNGVLMVEDGKLITARSQIKAASIDTSNKKRDDHLRQADFLDVEKFPSIVFESTGVEGDVLKGNFTMHGVTKAIELEYELLGPVKDPWGNTKVGLQASGSIDRTDFGLRWSKALATGGLVVGHKVELIIDLEAALK